MISAIVVGALLTARPGIGSNTDCPSSTDIESNLSVLLPGDMAQAGTALVSTVPEGLLVELRPENLAFWVQRRVAVGSSCEERARAAAVVIATWWPVETVLPTQVKANSEARVARESPHRIAVSAGGFASLISGGIAAGARIEAAWLPWGRAFGFRLALSETAAQGGNLGQGQAHWTRSSAEIGPTYARSILRLDGGLVGSLVWVEGSGHIVNQESSGAAVGATSGLRAGWAWGRTLPWLELRGIWWPQSQRIYISNPSTTVRTVRSIPHGELQVGGGVAFNFL